MRYILLTTALALLVCAFEANARTTCRTDADCVEMPDWKCKRKPHSGLFCEPPASQ